MATTKKIELSKNWVKLSDGDCTVQALNRQTSVCRVCVSADTPSDDDAYLLLQFNEPVNFGYGDAIWCRLADGSDVESMDLVVVSK